MILPQYRRLRAYVQTRRGDQLNVEQVTAGWAETYRSKVSWLRSVVRVTRAPCPARAVEQPVAA